MKIIRPESDQPIPKDAICVFRGIIYDVYQWQQKQFDGTFKKFEKLKRPDTVMVLPVTEDNKIMVAEQLQSGRKMLDLSALGGRMDPGEDVLTTAKRELLEESGYTANEFILWDAIQPVVKIDWVVYTFIGKQIKKAAEPKLDSGEQIKLKFLTLEQLVDAVVTGIFADTELLYKFLPAKLDPKKMQQLKKTFFS